MALQQAARALFSLARGACSSTGRVGVRAFAAEGEEGARGWRARAAPPPRPPSPPVARTRAPSRPPAHAPATKADDLAGPKSLLRDLLRQLPPEPFTSEQLWKEAELRGLKSKRFMKQARAGGAATLAALPAAAAAAIG